MKIGLIFLPILALLALGCGVVDKFNEALYPPKQKTIPEAKISVDSEKVKVGSQVTLNGTASTDPQNENLTYAWTVLEIPKGSAATLSSSTAAITTITVDKGGFYTVSLQVTNASTIVSPLTTLRIDAVGTGDNHPPVASAGEDQTAVVTGSVAVLDGSASYDQDEDSLLYTWTLLDAPETSTVTGLVSPGEVRALLYPDVDGDYTMRLRVSDGIDSDDDFVTVTSKKASTG